MNRNGLCDEGVCVSTLHFLLCSVTKKKYKVATVQVKINFPFRIRSSLVVLL